MRASGSRPVKRPNLERKLSEVSKMQHTQYFMYVPLYDSEFFRLRFLFSRSLFNSVFTSVIEHENYFKQKTNGSWRARIAAEAKVTAALCIQAYVMPPNAVY